MPWFLSLMSSLSVGSTLSKTLVICAPMTEVEKVSASKSGLLHTHTKASEPSAVMPSATVLPLAARTLFSASWEEPATVK